MSNSLLATVDTTSFSSAIKALYDDRTLGHDSVPPTWVGRCELCHKLVVTMHDPKAHLQVTCTMYDLVRQQPWACTGFAILLPDYEAALSAVLLGGRQALEPWLVDAPVGLSK